jgi:pyruvate kinase
MDVARLNFSYGSHAAHAETIRMLRSVADELGEPIGVLQDLSGPKLRVGELPGGGVELEAGREVVFSTARVVLPPKLPLPVPELAQAVKAGQRLMLADGQIEVTVLEAKKGEIRCRVRVGGRLESHQGVNAPEVALPVQTVTVKDLADLRFGLEHQVDWVAMSFVRTAEDLIPLRRAMSGAQAPPGLIAKIEKHEAVKRLSEIIAAADGVMVARGDLGIELPLAEVPMLQKEIIRLCNRAGKPAITATQMLESMITNSRPTRAEVSDVANAVLDGTDAVMLSGETAVGEHAEAAVAVMAEVVTKAEAGMDFEGRLEESRSWPCDGISDGISEAACGLARDVKARAIITATGSGYTAIMVSRHRPEMPLVAVTPDVATMRRLALVWGVHPVLAPRCRNTDELIVNAIGRARAAGWVSPGDRVVVTAGVPLGRGYTNLIKVEVVGRHHKLG